MNANLNQTISAKDSVILGHVCSDFSELFNKDWQNAHTQLLDRYSEIIKKAQDILLKDKDAKRFYNRAIKQVKSVLNEDVNSTNAIAIAYASMWIIEYDKPITLRMRN